MSNGEVPGRGKDRFDLNSCTSVPIHEMNRYQTTLASLALALSGVFCTSACAAREVAGVRFDDQTSLASQPLVLNGAGVRKRGYYKADVTALYLPQKTTNPDHIFKLNGVRRVQLNLLRDFTSATISRIFIADFKQVASDAEFKQLINEIGQIGSVYAAIPRVGKGDVINLDWVPGKGWMCFQNGKQIVTDMVPSGSINSELAFQIYMRMYIGQAAPENYRNGLLGIKD